MKKIVIIPIAIVATIILLVIAMFAFQLCPPSGPWPSPPWCGSNFYIPYEYKELSYITEKFEPTDKKLDIMISPTDYWGNPHLYINLGEDSRDHYKTTMKKIGEITNDGVMVSDFAGISDELGVGDTGFEGIREIPQNELNDLVNEANKNNQEKIFLITGLIDPEGPMRRYKEEGMEGTVQENLIQDQSLDNWQKLFDEWGTEIVKRAKKAETVGVTHMIVTSDFLMKFYEDKNYWNKRYSEYIDNVKKEFSGKIGLNIRLNEALEVEKEVLDKVDFVMVGWEPNSWTYKTINEDVVEDVDSIEESFVKWFNRDEWDYFNDKEVYLSLITTGYDGGLQKGWIEAGAVYGPEYVEDQKEQALINEGMFRALYNNDFNIDGVISYGYWWTDRTYPEVKIIRVDLSHSIRNKDAEHVFYKWNQIFK